MLFSRCLACVLVLGCGAGSPNDTPSIRRIFLITVDTLRADHLGAYGYPRETSPYSSPIASAVALLIAPAIGPATLRIFTIHEIVGPQRFSHSRDCDTR